MKRLFIFVFFLMLSPFVKAQYSSVMTSDISITGNGYSIVRNMSDNEVITYMIGSGYHRFTYENSSSLSYKIIDMPIPWFDDIVLQDFRVIDNIVYFCGTDISSSSGDGVLGCFDASLFLNTVVPNVPIDYFTVPGTSVLSRLDVYIDPVSGKPRVTAVGLDRTGNCGVWMCGVWVDCAGLMPGVTSAAVSVHKLYSNSATGEIEQDFDVVSTDSWVVLVGCGIIGGRQGLMLRRFPKGNPTDSEVNNVYYYGGINTSAQEEIHALHLTGENIAVAYRGVEVNNVTDFTEFRFFRISTMQNVNTQKYVIPYKSKLFEMAYMNKAKRVVVLNEFSSSSNSNFVYLIPYQTSMYNSVYVHDDTWDFQSVTNLDGSFFVGAGYFHFLMRDVSASFPANNSFSPTPVLCPEDENISIMIVDDIIPDVISLTIPYTSFMLPTNIKNGSPGYPFLLPKCFSPK